MTRRRRDAETRWMSYRSDDLLSASPCLPFTASRITMSFIFNLTRREIRSSWRRLLFFFLCIALGVGSVVALRSLIQNVTRAVGTDARALMTADFEISSTSDFSPGDLSKVDSVLDGSNIIEARNETITTSSMASPVDPTNENVRMVELKGIEPPFPLVG